MVKKPQNSVPKTEISPSGDKKGVSVKCLSVSDERRGARTFTYAEEAMERIWRNCKYPEKITFDQYYLMYARNNVAARVIETFPDYCWATQPLVTDSGGPSSRFSKRAASFLTEMFKWQDGVKMSMLSLMKQLDVLGGIGGEALMVFGFRDGGALKDPVKPHPNMEIAWVKLLHNGQFEPDKRNEDPSSEEYGDVVTYRTKDFHSSVDLNFSSQIAPNKIIHKSRCVHFKESGGLSYGTSRIQKCYNQLIDITKLSGASAEVYWLGAFSGLSVETVPDTEIEDDALAAVKDDVQKYFDGLARAFVLQGMKAKLLFPAIVSPKDHFDLQITMISLATGIPRRFLTGAEAAKLASQQDALNWDVRVMNRCDKFDGPKVVSPIFEVCIAAGALPKPRGGIFEVTWPRVQSIAMNERADASRNMTEAWKAYMGSGMSDSVPFESFLVYVCGFSDTDAADIAAKCDAKKFGNVVKTLQKTGQSSTTTATPAESARFARIEEVVDRWGEKMAELSDGLAQLKQAATNEGIQKDER